MKLCYIYNNICIYIYIYIYIIYNRLTKYTHKYTIIKNTQYSFFPRSNTTTHANSEYLIITCNY